MRADFSSELDGRFVGFGAGIAYECARSILHGTRGDSRVDQEFRKRPSPGIVVQVGGMNEGGCLLRYGGCDAWVTVAEGVNSDPSSEVEIAAILNIP